MNMLTLLAAVFWNAHSPWFQFAPALDFSEVKGAAMYRYTVLDDLHHSYEFVAADSKASLAPVWDKIPTGGFAVVCEGLDAASNSVGLAVHATKGRIPRYWKTAQFKEGSYPPAKRSYGEAAKMIYDYIFEFDSSQVILKTGKPDRSYFLNSYPCKMYADIIRSMITYAKMRPERAADAMRLADNAAEYLLSVSEPAGAPLAYFPPTYEPDTNQTYTLAAKKYRGQTMISYPAHAGDAFLKLGQASGKRKYIDAAVRIAETFLKLQLPDDSWYLKLWVKDGSAVNLRNEEDRGWYTSSPIGKDVTWVNAAIGSYNGLFTTGADFCKAFDVFLDPSNYPVDFHCSAGRDRTGVTAYILNAVLGVAKADLDKDWEANIFQDPTPEFNHTNTLDKFTANLAKFDGVTVNEQAYGFLRSLGYTESQISTFREIMLEPATKQYR